MDSSFAEKNLGAQGENKVNISRQCALAVKKANSILGWIRQNIASWLREMILSDYSALVRPHPEYCFQFWPPHYKRDMDILK